MWNLLQCRYRGVVFRYPYKFVLSDKPYDGSLNELFQATGGNTNIYFTSDSGILQWFWVNGRIKASTVTELREFLDSGCTSIYEYSDIYYERTAFREKQQQSQAVY